MEAISMRFAAASRVLAHRARRLGYRAPTFRTPPRVTGAERTVRRVGSGATVAVAVRGRPWPAVLADLVEGVVVTNRLAGAEAQRLRAELWEALGADPRTQSPPAAVDAA